MKLIPNLSKLLGFLIIINIATAFRLVLNSKSPQVSLFFNVNGKQTFDAVSSGEENHDIQVII